MHTFLLRRVLSSLAERTRGTAAAPRYVCHGAQDLRNFAGPRFTPAQLIESGTQLNAKKRKEVVASQ